MNESQRRAWRALGIGPLWRVRAPAGDAAPVGIDPLAREAARPVDEAAEHAEETTEAINEPGAETSGALGLDPLREAIIEARDLRVEAMDWSLLRAAVADCRVCTLCRTRRNTVFGTGSEQARWLFVGEAPGAEEDASGEPFVGQAGRLLDNMLAAIGLARATDVYIANVLKCRPPANRNPQPEEVRSCEPYLRRQIELLSPRVIVVLGRFAAQALLQTEASIASLRGRTHAYALAGRTIPVIVTYHPAYLLRQPEDKAKSWSDLVRARQTFAQAGG